MPVSPHAMHRPQESRQRAGVAGDPVVRVTACAKTSSFDHVVRGNVFCLGAGSPALMLATPDCTGIEVYQ
jgi:hypothetical protein